MAIVSSYPQGTPTLNDTVIGTQYVENKEPVTKQFNINDIVDLVPVVYAQLPYQVFTALLTQSGGDNIEQISSGELTAGVTYLFIQSQAGDDFRNVGGPLVTYVDEFSGTSFVATLTATPNNWGEAVLYYNTGAPVATVLENTIGNVWFTYFDTGFYGLYSLDLFIPEITFCQGTCFADEDGTSLQVVSVRRSSEGLVTISSTRPIQEMAYNYILYNTPIEIRVYN